MDILNMDRKQPTMEITEPMARGMRNNNPLNIRRTRTQWKGQRNTQTDHDFVQFRSLSWGIRAAFCLLHAYASKYGLCSVEQIVSRWAPPSENDTQGYIGHVCRLTGLHPKHPLDPCQCPCWCKPWQG